MGRPSPVVHRKVRDVPLGGRSHSQESRRAVRGLPADTSSFVLVAPATGQPRRTANVSELLTLTMIDDRTSAGPREWHPTYRIEHAPMRPRPGRSP